MVTTGATGRAKLQSTCHHQQTNIQFSLQAGCPSCYWTSSVRALEGNVDLLFLFVINVGKSHDHVTFFTYLEHTHSRWLTGVSRPAVHSLKPFGCKQLRTSRSTSPVAAPPISVCPCSSSSWVPLSVCVSVSVCLRVMIIIMWRWSMCSQFGRLSFLSSTDEGSASVLGFSTDQAQS